MSAAFVRVSWLVGILTTLSMGMAASWAHHMDVTKADRVQVEEIKQSQTRELDNVQIRLDRIEDKQDAIKAQLDYLVERAVTTAPRRRPLQGALP